MDGIPPAPRVVPHTGTTFDTSANGLLNTSAADSPQAVHQITTINEKCRLLQAEVDYMVQKAESSVLKTSPTSQDRGQKRCVELVSFDAHSDKEKPKDTLEGGNKERIRLQCRRLGLAEGESTGRAARRLLVLAVSSTLRGALHKLLP